MTASFFRSLRCSLALLAGSAALVQATPPPPKEPTAAVAAELVQLRSLTDKRDYPAALALIDRLLPAAVNPSFDLALLSQVKGQIFLAEGRYEPALASLQTAAELGLRDGFFEEPTLLDTLYLVSQLHAHLAAEPGSTSSRPAHLAAALDYALRWQVRAPAPNIEVQLHVASLYYHLALLDPARPDLAQLQHARLAAEESLLLENTPREASYVMLLAALQQLGQREATADILELLIKTHPGTALYWQQLAGTYLSLAADAPEAATTARYQLRALLTLERAQALGQLSTPQDLANVTALRAILSPSVPVVAAQP